VGMVWVVGSNALPSIIISSLFIHKVRCGIFDPLYTQINFSFTALQHR
jgi:uncharacterized membrane protein